VHDDAKAAPVSIGTCGAVTVGGKATFTDNASTANVITDTTIHGVLSCTGNGGIAATDDTAKSAKGQCTA
jgi:hypothetical protein